VLACCAGLGDVTLLKFGVDGPHRAQRTAPSGRLDVGGPPDHDMGAVLGGRNPENTPDAWCDANMTSLYWPQA
jgi:hypothetical protein